MLVMNYNATPIKQFHSTFSFFYQITNNHPSASRTVNHLCAQTQTHRHSMIQYTRRARWAGAGEGVVVGPGVGPGEGPVSAVLTSPHHHRLLGPGAGSD